MPGAKVPRGTLVQYLLDCAVFDTLGWPSLRVLIAMLAAQVGFPLGFRGSGRARICVADCPGIEVGDAPQAWLPPERMMRTACVIHRDREPRTRRLRPLCVLCCLERSPTGNEMFVASYPRSPPDPENQRSRENHLRVSIEKDGLCLRFLVPSSPAGPGGVSVAVLPGSVDPRPWRTRLGPFGSCRSRSGYGKALLPWRFRGGVALDATRGRLLPAFGRIDPCLRTSLWGAPRTGLRREGPGVFARVCPSRRGVRRRPLRRWGDLPASRASGPPPA